jgi:hypothetical protein
MCESKGLKVKSIAANAYALGNANLKRISVGEHSQQARMYTLHMSVLSHCGYCWCGKLVCIRCIYQCSATAVTAGVVLQQCM